MNIAQSVKTGIFVVIFLNLIMAFSSIWIFMRMSPAIEDIISENERSLKACEEMLTSLALISKDESFNKKLLKNFNASLKTADANITEEKEPQAILNIKENYNNAFEGLYLEKQKTISAIKELAEINRNAMIKADLKAKKLGYAGAWTIVFMASTIFFTGILFKRILRKHLLNPIYEIHSVVHENLNGNKHRRCSGQDLSQDIKIIYNELNQYIDRCQQLESFTISQG